MKKLFLLSAITLIAIMAVSSVSAACCTYNDWQGISTCSYLGPGNCLASPSGVWHASGACIQMDFWSFCGIPTGGTPSTCWDSDLGKNYESYDYVINELGVKTYDACQTSDILVEMYCNGDMGTAELKNCKDYGAPFSCSGGRCVPEFTTIGMGLAVMGAGLGFALIRKKRK
jgi:hypothetical protein